MSDEIEIDEKKLKSFLQLKPTLEHTAMFFECSERTIERFIRRRYDKTFMEFRDAQMNTTRHALIQTAISEALGAAKKVDADGNVISKGKPVNTTMLIFTLKNLADWSDNDRPDTTGKEDGLLFIDDEDPDGNELATPVKRNVSKTD